MLVGNTFEGFGGRSTYWEHSKRIIAAVAQHPDGGVCRSNIFSATRGVAAPYALWAEAARAKVVTFHCILKLSDKFRGGQKPRRGDLLMYLYFPAKLFIQIYVRTYFSIVSNLLLNFFLLRRQGF